MERGQHNVTEIADFAEKPFLCPVCNIGLKIKITRKQKPYCICLECGIQIFFRGQEGIKRLWDIIRSEEAVRAEFNGPARALSLLNRVQGLKQQRKHLEEQQGIVFPDPDRDKAIQALDAEIERVRTELKQEVHKTEKQR
jgi:hypothetical protein